MPNETLNTIHSRRSIRRYTAQPVTEEDIRAIMDAVIYAPSANNSQAWHFSVVRSEATLAKVRAVMKQNMLTSGVTRMVERASVPGFVPFYNTPVLILLSADPAYKYAQIDCGIAVQTIALAAESLGLGSCIMASSELLFAVDTDGSLACELGFPQGYRHVVSICLGYKNEAPEAKERNAGLVDYL
jgi:nitroreductase